MHTYRWKALQNTENRVKIIAYLWDRDWKGQVFPSVTPIRASPCNGMGCRSGTELPLSATTRTHGPANGVAKSRLRKLDGHGSASPASGMGSGPTERADWSSPMSINIRIGPYVINLMSHKPSSRPHLTASPTPSDARARSSYPSIGTNDCEGSPRCLKIP